MHTKMIFSIKASYFLPVQGVPTAIFDYQSENHEIIIPSYLKNMLY